MKSSSLRYLAPAAAIAVAGAGWLALRQPSAPEQSASRIPSAATTVVSAQEPFRAVAGTVTQPKVLLEPDHPLMAEAFHLAENASDQERDGLARSLAELGPGALDDLASALRSAPTFAAKATLAKAMALIGTSEAVDALLNGLRDLANPAQRAALVQMLGLLKDASARETLTSALAELDDPVLRQSATAVVGRIANGDTVQFLAELYHSPATASGQSSYLTTALASIANPEATEALRQIAADSPEIDLQVAAALSLSRIGTPEALEGILSALFRVADTNTSLRQGLLNDLAAVANPQATDWLAQQSASPNMPEDIAASMKQALAKLR